MNIVNHKMASSISTGGGGYHFELQAQTAFGVLMLTGGCISGYSGYRIKEIRQQVACEGRKTDDFEVVLERSDEETVHILCQAKRKVSISSKGDFPSVIKKAWQDFSDRTFVINRDIIVLITGPISKNDTDSMLELLARVRAVSDFETFFFRIEEVNLPCKKIKEKLTLFRELLRQANGNKNVSDKQLYDFLRSFRLWGFDFQYDDGINLSLLYSHITQCTSQLPSAVWSELYYWFSANNQCSGIIRREDMPSTILAQFEPVARVQAQGRFPQIPEKFQKNNLGKIFLSSVDGKNKKTMLFAVLLGRWDENNINDQNIISLFIGDAYSSWQNKMRELREEHQDFIFYKNGEWEISYRQELLESLSDSIYSDILQKYKNIIISVLGERNPIFDLQITERFASVLYGKVLKYSISLREGLAHGIAILGTSQISVNNYTHDILKDIAKFSIEKLLYNIDYSIWGSLNPLLPILAEAAPDKFLAAVDNAISQSPCPYVELFSQESTSIGGSNYMTGLLWALERLAWNCDFFNYSCDLLCALAQIDTGGQWMNRPLHSLTSILIPWRPQTLAPVSARKQVVKNLVEKYPEVAWPLLLKLLPGSVQYTGGTQKPTLSLIVPEDYNEKISRIDYHNQTSFYFELLFSFNNENTEHLCQFVDLLDSAPKEKIKEILDLFSKSTNIKGKSIDRVKLWKKLRDFVIQSKRFRRRPVISKQEMKLLESIVTKLEPKNIVLKYEDWFNKECWRLIETKSVKNISLRTDFIQKKIVKEIYCLYGLNPIMRLAKKVDNKFHLGWALGEIDNAVITQKIFCTLSDNVIYDFVKGYICKQFYKKGWAWVDEIDRNPLSKKDRIVILCSLPMVSETWIRVAEWLKNEEAEYWENASECFSKSDTDIFIAAGKFIQYKRFGAAIKSLSFSHSNGCNVEPSQIIAALLGFLSNGDDISVRYDIEALISLLQNSDKIDINDLIVIEWGYLPLIQSSQEMKAKTLELALSNSPEFFSELISLLFRGANEPPVKFSSEEAKQKIDRGFALLRSWRVVPGTLDDGRFDITIFQQWWEKANQLCEKTDHLEIAQREIGKVLFYTPADKNTSLWIHKSIAALLNQKNMSNLRFGYRNMIINSRGMHIVDPTGKPELELSNQYFEKARALDLLGYSRFAQLLKEVAEYYQQEVMRIKDSYRNR